MKCLFRFAVGAVMLAALPLLSGCAGYHIGPIPPKFMAGVHTIAVPTFHNQTLIPRLEVLAADSVIKQFQQDGTFKIASKADADVVIEGNVVSVQRFGARSVRSDLLTQQEYNLYVTLGYAAIKRSTGEQIELNTVVGTTSFFVSGNDVNQDERQAIPLALSDAAVRVVSHLTEGW